MLNVHNPNTTKILPSICFMENNKEQADYEWFNWIVVWSCMETDVNQTKGSLARLWLRGCLFFSKEYQPHKIFSLIFRRVFFYELQSSQMDYKWNRPWTQTSAELHDQSSLLLPYKTYKHNHIGIDYGGGGWGVIGGMVFGGSLVERKKLLHQTAHNQDCGLAWVTGSRFLETLLLFFFFFEQSKGGTM